MHQAVILGAVRTPIGKFQGALRSLSAPQLAAVAVREAVSRAGVSSKHIDELWLGNVLGAGLGQAPARRAALLAGLAQSVATNTVNKVCGSGMRAVISGVQSIACGDNRFVVAAGAESMSNAPHLLAKARGGYRLAHGELVDVILRDGLVCSTLNQHMGEITERTALSEGIGREEQDAFARESYQRARRAIADGSLAAEIVPVSVGGTVAQAAVSQDEQPHADDIEKLSRLKPAFREDGTITAGNASSLNDGAAALVLANEAEARGQGHTPLAKVVAYAGAAHAPEHFATAPITAIRKALANAKLGINDIDLFEINQAFSAVSLVVEKSLELDRSRVDVYGGAVALGHPIGASGARIIVTLLHAMRTRGARRGLAAICIGGGEALAIILERT